MEKTKERFKLLFDGLQRVHGRYMIDEDLSSRTEKVKGQAITKKEPLTTELWDKHFAGTQGLGVVPIRDDQACVFCALDIDEYNLDLKKLNAEIQKLQLPFVTCRTKSGGAHLYMFFKEPVPAKLVRLRLKEMANALGYPAVEIFPKQNEIKPGDVGNWINLPYYRMNGPTTRYALDADGAALMTLDQFVDYADSRKVSKEALKKLDVEPTKKPFVDGPPCLQRLAEHGFPQGTRNNSLFNVGVYLRQKYPDDWRDKLEEYNHKYMKPPLKSQEVAGSIKSLSKDKYFYKCEDEPICSVCSRDACLGRKYGIGGGGDDGEVQLILGTLQKTVMLDQDGNELTDEIVEWYMDVDGKQLTFSTTQLLNQDAFIKKLAETVMKVPMKVNGRRWHMMIKEKVETATVVELSPDSGRYGHIYEAVRDFVQDSTPAETKAEIEAGHVWRDEFHYLWFKPQMFWEFLVKRGIYRASDSRHELYRIMTRHLGAEKKQLMIDSNQNINRDCWRLKAFHETERTQETPPKDPKAEF